MLRKAPLAALTVASVLLAGSGAAQAAPPANDAFAAATPLAVGQEISGTNLEATAEPGEPNNGEVSQSSTCAALTDGPHCSTSVWLSFKVSSMGTHTIETCDMGTDMDTVLGLYTGATIGTAVKVISNDDTEGCSGGGTTFGSKLVFTAAAGVLYHVALTGFAGDEGSFYIRAYPGEGQPRPKPDTRVVRNASFLRATFFGGAGVTSGPRHSPGFPLESDVPGATFECSLDGAPFTACAPPVDYTGLAPGSSHVFQARALAAGATDPTPVIERFTLDSTGPDTALTSGPSGTTASQEATWTTSSSERNNQATFSCRLDGQEASSCGVKANFKELCQGPHDFGIAGVDRAGNVDPSPASAHIDVTSGPACAAPTIGPPGAPTPSVTRAFLTIPYDNKGAGALLRTEYGPTAVYGMRVADMRLAPEVPAAANPVLKYLLPGTEYHYRVTITTPFGSASTGDQTLITKPLEGTLPVPQNAGAPKAGYFTAALPVSIDAAGVSTLYGALVDTAKPVTADSPAVFAPELVEAASAGPQGRTLQLADLEPGTTYNYRIAAVQIGVLTANEALGPEGTFTTLALPLARPAVSKTRFKLRKGQVRVGELRRKSRKLIVSIRRLPTGSKAKLRLKVGKKKQLARKKARPNGRVRFRMILSKRIRKELLDDSVKRFRLRVTALPPEDPPSSVTFTKRIRGG